MILEVVLAPMPPIVLYIAAGIIFGGFVGGILTLFGNVVGALIDFKIAKFYGKNFVDKKVDKKLKQKFDRFFSKHGVLAIFILRINPFTTSDLVSYLSGLTKMKTYKFLLATGLGLIPLIFVQTYLGDVILKDNPILIGITILFSLVYLAIFAYIIIISSTKNHQKNLKP